MHRFASALVILILAIAGLTAPVMAQQSDRPLTRQDVRDYIRLRIQTHQIQQRYKANQAQYDNVIAAFYEERNTFLQKKGWDPDRFDTVQKRILGAQSTLEMATKQDGNELEERLDDLEHNDYMSDDQKAEVRKQIVRMDSLRRAQLFGPTKRDWPAVRPYTGALEHLTDYVAGNRSDPPDVSALPPASP